MATSCLHPFVLLRRFLLPTALLLGVVQVHAGLIAHYKFDETSGTTATDSSGSGNTGTLTNMAGTEWTTGKVGGALDFDGLGGYVQLSQITAIGSTSSTVAMWVKIPVVGQGNLSGGERVGNIMGNYNSSPNMNLEVHNDGQIRYYIGSQKDVYGSLDLRDNQWHHLAFVRDKGNDKLFGYVDGGVDLTSNGSGSDVSFNTSFRIGRDYRGGSGIPFHGSIDDLRIYNSALSASEVSALAAGASTAPEPASVFASLGLLTAAGCGLREWRRRKKKA